MFCPPEYVPLVDLMQRWQDERFEVNLRRVNDHAAQQVAEGQRTAREAFLSASPADASESELLISLEADLFMVAPTGLIMKLARGLIVTTTAWNVTIPVLEGATEHDPSFDPEDEHFPAAFRLFDFLPDLFFHLFDGARKQDPEITPWELADKMGGAWRHCILPQFHERVGYTISLQGYDRMKKLGLFGPPMVDLIAERLRPFEGWALCAPREIGEPDEWERRIRSLERTPRLPSELGGRPPETLDAYLIEYTRRYPQGHGSRTRKELWKELRQATGVDGSISTVDRMLKVAESRSGPY